VGVFDGLAVVEDALGLGRVEGCKPPFVPQAQPGPCPHVKSKLKAIGRRRAIARRAAPAGGGGGYAGPRFGLPADSAAGQRRAAQEQAIAAAQEKWRQSIPGDGRPDEAAARQQMAAALRDLWGGKKIAVRVTADSLENILRTGRFKTVHETYRSGGPNTPARRAELEEQLFGIDPSGPKEKRPVYGYVAVNGLRWQKLDSALGQYGSVQVILKDDVRKRTTASNGDSMGQRSTVRPSPVDAPQHWSWSVRGQQPGNFAVNGEELAQRGYAEAQVHGGVSTADIEEVIFPREPEDRVKRRLDEKGIPWRVAQD
jgi:hypothetical protein